MAAQGSRKSSIPQRSGIPTPTKESLAQPQTPETSRRSSIPIKRNSTTPESLKSPLRSLLPVTDNDGRRKEGQYNVSPLAVSAAARSSQYDSESLHKAGYGFQDKIPRLSCRLKSPNRQQQPSKIPTPDVTVRAKKDVNREPSTPEQHSLNTPVSLGNLREKEIKDRSKVALRQTKSALPVLHVPPATIVDPKDDLPMSGVETGATDSAAYQSTPTSGQESADDRTLPVLQIPAAIVDLKGDLVMSGVESDATDSATYQSTPTGGQASADDRYHAQTPYSEITSLIHALEHFTFVCLLDPNSPEKPIHCASKFPWPSIQLREKLEQFYPNALRQDGKVCEIIADVDSEGNEKSYMTLIDDFPTVVTDNRNYSLAWVVDVTSFINAVVPNERMHEPQVVNEATVRNDHSKSKDVPVLPSFKDRMTTILRHDGNARFKASVARRERRSLRLQHYLEKNSQENYAQEDLMGRTVAGFTEKFLEFYNNHFMLGRSSSADEYYEITHVSDNIYRKKEYIDGHLTHSSSEVFMEIKKSLGREERFTIRVQWGHNPTEKRLYCVPLSNDPENQGWICLLVDSELPLLWQTGFRRCPDSE